MRKEKSLYKRKELLGLIFTIFLMTFVLGDVRYDEDNAIEFHTNLDNRFGDTDVDSMRVSIFIPDLALMFHSNSVDLDNNDIKSVWSFIEEVPAGEHFVRVCAHNDDENKCVYRYVDFI